ncbi:c-type cytochrome [Sulfurimonas sp. HSL-1716]|uniref:c-type cytochrome n=1 Tax=Hydrocurvibacter sulfurireducens TaxID=3131937 RepID=UPI0031F9C3D1
MKKTVFLLLAMTISLLAEDGASLYAQNCQSCHGKNGETAALNKALPIKGWDKAKTIEALNAYKAGTRNTTGLGKIMTPKVATMTDAQIAAVSEYIATLK